LVGKNQAYSKPSLKKMEELLLWELRGIKGFFWGEEEEQGRKTLYLLGVFVI
jgi:hypothetical protein